MTPTPSPNPTPTGNRIIRAVNVSAPLGAQQVTVPFELISQGNEASISFTAIFESSRLSNPVVTLGTGVPVGASLGTNVNQVAAGRIGILVDSTNTYVAGIRQIVTIRFDVSPNFQIGLTPVNLGSVPTPQFVSDGLGVLLPTAYTLGFVQIGSTAAGVEISGRVVTPDGRGLRNAQVSITDSGGTMRTATTSSFGFYRFDGLSVGETFVIEVSSKRYRFAARVLQTFETLSNIDFVGQD